MLQLHDTPAPLLECWAERDEKRSLRQAEQRVRERVEALYALSDASTDVAGCRRLARRCLVEAEGLVDLADDVLRREGVVVARQAPVARGRGRPRKDETAA
jgi:hypothetical protein